MSTHLRRDYQAGQLRRADLARDPFAQFEAWYAEACAHPQILEPNAMALATAGADGAVAARTVLLKIHDTRGFAFFTNYTSAKARQMEENPQAALLFNWLPLERQIIIRGPVEKTPVEESAAYFASRPPHSQIAAWASHQSRPVASREVLEEKYRELEKKFGGSPPPPPEFWGGYRVVPRAVEFWQGRASRLHDRFVYTRGGGGDWHIERLSP